MTKANNNNNEPTFSQQLTSVEKTKHVNGVSFTPALKYFYNHIITFRIQGNQCWKAHQTLADDLGISVGSVKNYSKDLEAMGLLKVTNRKGESNLYHAYTIEEAQANGPQREQTKRPNNLNTIKNITPKTDNIKSKAPEPVEAKQEPKAPGQPKIEPPKQQQQIFDPFDDFLDSCGISHDKLFEEHQSNKRSAPKPLRKHDAGRICEHCYFDNAERHWDCGDSKCRNNKIPF